MNTHVAYKPACAGSPVVELRLPLSKSISNRRLIIDALAGETTPRHAVAVCDDTEAMLTALAAGGHGHINVGAAGTAMRFLTAYFAAVPGCDVVLDGSERMRQRPIGILVDALRTAGARIDYVGRPGFPPLHIMGRELEGGAVEMDAGVSSQYTSALLMVAPVMTLGLQLTLKGRRVSQPYIAMTLAMMQVRGIEIEQQDSDTDDYMISVRPMSYRGTAGKVEADWSAASYWYETCALTGRSFRLNGLCRDSLQGDACVAAMFASLGVATDYDCRGGVTIKRISTALPGSFEADMECCPDLAQTVVATCCGLGVPFRLTGLSTLRIKETDRLEALRSELARLGYDVKVAADDTLEWNGSRLAADTVPVINTYNDHRMAMALAPLAATTSGEIVIADAGVVTKSYPLFWQHLAMAGYTLTEQ